MNRLIQADRVQPQTRLTREHKEAVGLLSIGTFLEYFDLMLYIHMAGILNELFSHNMIPMQHKYFHPLLFVPHIY